ncbi:MAG: hypothetical protein HC783_07365 [Rhodobacteraceae bacterium]|nr:hypothetical protein [Paracoccaceae bacterium]
MVFLPFVLLWLALLYLPFAMRSWRAFLALCTVYLLVGIGVRLGVATYSAADVPVAMVFLGNFWLDFVVWALPVPILARGVVLAAKSLGLGGKRLIALNVVGILALPGSWFGMAAYDRWDRRPAPVECTATPVSLMLSGVDGQVPWSAAINLYLGPDLPKDARYLFSAKSQRRICSETLNGTERLTIAALSVELRRAGPQRCTAADVLPWEKALCGKTDDPDLRGLPHDVVFFDPNGIRLGYFGIPKALTDEAYPLAPDERLVMAGTEDNGPVMAVCRKEPYSNGQVLCFVRAEIAEQINMSWEIYARPDEIADRLLRASAFSRKVCASIFDLPGCRSAPGTAP